MEHDKIVNLYEKLTMNESPKRPMNLQVWVKPK